MQLLNFQIQGTTIEVAGQSFNLHHFDLQGYGYDTGRQIFTLTLKGLSYETSSASMQKAIVELKIIFAGVTFLRIQDASYDESHVCLVLMKFLDEVLVSHRKTALPVQVDQLFMSDEFPTAEWPNYLLMTFMGGVALLIAAATGEVLFSKLMIGNE